VERGTERIVWEKMVTFCVAEQKEKFFAAELLQIAPPPPKKK
jgi:hypothetical protein